jgi:hypothetical protein
MGKGVIHMAKTNTLIQNRIKLLKEMDSYICNTIDDEDIWETWIAVGVPDGATEDDYRFMAEDEDIWRETCILFGEIIKEVSKWTNL